MDFQKFQLRNEIHIDFRTQYVIMTVGVGEGAIKNTKNLNSNVVNGGRVK